MDKNKRITFILALAAIPAIIYFYFLPWRTNTIFGDDLYIYVKMAGPHSLKEINDIWVNNGKFRPVCTILLNILFDLFQKNLNDYYLFSVAIQALNVFIFAGILNYFLKSRYLSILFALIIGISRFSFFNISQLFNGGPMEGLAMSFFLAALFYMIKAISQDGQTASQKQKAILVSILYANLSMYTHERYIVFFLFLAVTVLLFPGLRILSRKQRFGLIALAVFSIVLNVAIKKYVYSNAFFVGTGGTNISFSFTSAFSYLEDGILSILQINSGPEYLTGIQFPALSLLDKILAITVAAGMVTVLVVFIVKIGRQYITREKSETNNPIFLLLLMLFFLLIVPVVLTIRLEPRWLQGPLAIFVLLLIVAWTRLPWGTRKLSKYVCVIFVSVFLWVDYSYFTRGSDNLSLITGERIAGVFKDAIDQGRIRESSKKIYFWARSADINANNGMTWILGEGAIFQFYQDGPKKLFFVDSVYEHSYPFAFSSFRNFNRDSAQILYLNQNDLGFSVVDLTDAYLQDSLKYFVRKRINDLTNSHIVTYDQDDLVISGDNFTKFVPNGFYDEEKGTRWTNGKASIGFIGDYSVRDSLYAQLNAYMPPVCKNVSIRLSMVDTGNKEHLSVSYKRLGDKNTFSFYFEQPTAIKAINILSDTISPGDGKRVLSFPFESLRLKKMK